MSIIPNIITLGNLFCGILAITADKTEWALGFIFLAAVLDFFDGLVARALGVSSEMGKQLDSLADVVSFGVAPAILVQRFLMLFISPVSIMEYILVYSPYLLAIAGAWRLARFNIDPSQSSYFKGLPIPANGFFWIGFLMIFDPKNPISADLTLIIPLTFIMVLVLALVMVSKLKLLNFKVKHIGFKGNEARYVLLILGAFISIYAINIERAFLAIPAVLLLYIVISTIHYYILHKNEVQS